MTRRCGPRRCPQCSVSSQRLVGVDDAFIQFGESPRQCVMRNTSCQCRNQRTLAALLHGLIAFRSPKSGYVRVRFYENEVTTGAFISSVSRY